MEGKKRQEYEKFHQQLQREVEMYLDKDGIYKPKKEVIQGKIREYLLLVPNFFLLLYNLLLDKRVAAANKTTLAMALAYIIFPLDFLPEIFFGPLGYLDDLVVAVLALDRVLNHTSFKIVKEHWRGEEDILLLVQEIIKNSQNFLDQRVWRKVKEFLDKKSTFKG